MFFIHEMERRITLHPSYFGRNMTELVTAKLLKDVEGTTAGSFYIIAILDGADVSEGRILPGSGNAEFVVRYRAVIWRPFKHEVVDSIVESVNQHGFTALCGSLKVFVSSHQVPRDMKWDPNATPPNWSNNSDQTIEIGTHVRARILNFRQDIDSLWAIGSINGDYLGALLTT